MLKYLLPIFLAAGSSHASAQVTLTELTQSDSPLFNGLQSYQMNVSSPSSTAKQYFNQGLILFYGFNYPEALRSFKQAAKIDPNCALFEWAKAISLAEYIQSIQAPLYEEARLALQKASEKSRYASPKEKELISALAGRFEKKSGKWQLNNDKFVQHMKTLYIRYPNDPDITALYAKAYMENFDMASGMEDKIPKGNTKEVLDILEKGLKKYPNHPGINHFYLHALIACEILERGADSAQRLDGAYPGSGHLQHMPAHVYFTLGKYHDATLANLRGIEADTELFKQGGIKDPACAGYYLHNHHFLFKALMMEGRSEEALKQSRLLLTQLKSKYYPSNGYLNEVFYSVPYLLLTRFGKWDAIPNEPAPPKEFAFATGAFEYAMALSKIRNKQLPEAKQILERMERRRGDIIAKGIDHQPLAIILDIACLDIRSQIAFAKGNPKEAIDNLRTAVGLEDGLKLEMLPWYLPMRQALGDALLKINNPREAEKIFKEDLVAHPNNGWALAGLISSIKNQKRFDENDDLQNRFDEAWKYADITLTNSRL